MMFLNLKQVIQDENGDCFVTPILVRSEAVSCFYPSDDQNPGTIILLNNGLTVFVTDLYPTIYDRVHKSVDTKKTGWVPCKQFLPDVEDDYIVSIGKDMFNSYSVDVDSFKKGKWKNYGKSVLAWMPFPDPYGDAGKEE